MGTKIFDLSSAVPNGNHHPDLPRSEVAEANYLSCSLIDDGVTLTTGTKSGLTKEAFSSPENKLIYTTLVAMQASHVPVALDTLIEELKRKGKLRDAGGLPYLVELTKCAPTTAEVSYHVKTLKDMQTRRGFLATCELMKEECLDPNSDIEDAYAHAEEGFRRSKDFEASGLPPLRQMQNCLGAYLPPLPEELVGGILHRGSKLVIGGTSKGMKSWSLMDLGLSVATGTDWWGYKCLRGKVVYLNLEIAEPFFFRRIETLIKAKNFMVKDDMFQTMTMRGSPHKIEDLADKVIELLRGKGIALIIIDPVYKMLGDRDENKAGDIASLMGEIEAVAVETGAAVAIGAHYSKGNQSGKESIDRIGGSGVFARDPDAIITMTNHQEKDCVAVEMTLRNFPPQQTVVLEWKHPLWERRDDLNPDDLKETKSKKTFARGTEGRSLKYPPEKLVQFVPGSSEEGASPRIIYRHAEEATGIGKTFFYAILKDMLDQKWVSQDAKGGQYRRTSHGDEICYAYLDTVETYDSGSVPK